jgi:hypothetical protein
MKPFFAACLALLLGSTAPTVTLAADSEPPVEHDSLQAPFQSDERTYFREHRLRAYERTRAGIQKGATCVTQKGVCWIADPLSEGETCSCSSQRLGTILGTVGG